MLNNFFAITIAWGMFVLYHYVEFPFGGMPCPVRGCPSTFYKSFKSLENHWKAIHCREIKLYKFVVCARSFSRMSDAKKHSRSHHSGSVISFYKRNERFMSPGLAALPKRPKKLTLLDENPGLTPRERAAEERHLIAAASSNVPLLALSDRGSSFVNRDEEVFTTNDGQTIRHPKSRRFQSPEEEVVLDYEDDLEM